MRKILATALLLGASPLPAQSWRTIAAQRPRQASDSLRVRLDFAAGVLRLGPAAPSTLYDLHFRFDAERFSASAHYDSVSRTLELGTADPPGRRRSRSYRVGIGGGAQHPNELTVALARATALDLSLDLGATKATVDLGGLSIRALHLRARASETSITFSSPNPVALDQLDIDAGAASVSVGQLGNARVRHLRARAAMGGLELGFGGAWTGDIDLRLIEALGTVTLHVPRDVGVKVRLDKLAATFDHTGLASTGDGWITPGFERAAHKLVVDADATISGLTIDWIER
ncbi:MAG: hypothetical protein M3068_14705 [Gemmatimonadota bacterium]|nr:hypothetical protein [Gemmatimonadota bacterium]